MYAAEKIRLKEGVVCPEKTKPQVQEHCITHTLNRADGSFEAEFSLELTGVMAEKVDMAGKVDNESHDLKKKHAENYMGMLCHLVRWRGLGSGTAGTTGQPATTSFV